MCWFWLAWGAGDMVQAIPSQIEVVVVGAGIAGLYAAYRLRQAQIPFVVLEADPQVGGRIQSRPEAGSKLGLTLDEGANLINSTDTIAIKLMDRFNIAYVRRLRSGAESMHYLYKGQNYEQAEFDKLLFADSGAAIDAILLDQERWRTDEKRDYNSYFIDESITSYLQRIGAGPMLRDMLWSFFWSEYGRELENLSLHVLFDYLAMQRVTPAFRLIPNVDEAYTVPQGMEQIIDALLAQVADVVHVAKPVRRLVDDGDTISVETKEHVIIADHVIFAAPLHSLRRIDVLVDGLTDEELADARAATYARGTKLHLKFDSGFHDLYDDAGILLTDTGEQIWISSTGQGEAGLLTVLTGPLAMDGSAGAAKVRGVVDALDKIRPGLARHFVGFEQSHAPTSYSGSLRPGEEPRLTIHEGGPRLTMAGEASSRELQGYLEGALRSAEDGTTAYILRRARQG
jgi:monoamine oxidase